MLLLQHILILYVLIIRAQYLNNFENLVNNDEMTNFLLMKTKFGNKIRIPQDIAQSLQFFAPNKILSKTILKQHNYCDPPNPCPLGISTDNECIDANFFENSAEFNRNYQLQQKCPCDTEHMFSCPNENVYKRYNRVYKRYRPFNKFNVFI